MPDTQALRELAAQLYRAELALRTAVLLCPGDVGLAAGLLDRADWCRVQQHNTTRRLVPCTARRTDDQQRRSE